MIHSVSANQQSFHTVNFTTGLNVILADRSDTSSEKDTRNGIGKSTLIEIIDFCLGNRATKGKGLIIEPLEEWAFTLDITLGGNRVKVTRAIEDKNRIVVDGPTTGWPEQPDLDDESGERVFKVDRWRLLLGQLLFGLPKSTDQLPYNPSYRSLVSYFIRRGPDAYANPFSHFSKQATWDTQLHVAYLLGMNWEFASRWQGLKDKESGLTALNKAIKTGVVEGAIGTVGEMETKRIQLERQVAKAKEALDSFKVLPQYESVQNDADSLTKNIHELINSNVDEKRRLSRYEDSIEEEKPPASMSLEKLYEESGLVFPDSVRRTLEESRSFHKQIVSNRRGFLEMEIKHIRGVIDEREKQIEELTERRSELMQLLKTHGALQEMTTLQERHVKLHGELERVKTHLHELKDFKKTKREIKTTKTELTETAELDHEERREVWSEAVSLFNEHSQALYKTPGKLIIDVSDTGYKYQVDIERSGSAGIDKMKIFCFDLAMLRLQIQTREGIDFLVHDTLMYDSVDARQRALAFELAHEVADELGAQYICTMNSDMVPVADFSEGFDFTQYVRLTLSDAKPSQSLLGIRF